MRFVFAICLLALIAMGCMSNGANPAQITPDPPTATPTRTPTQTPTPGTPTPTPVPAGLAWLPTPPAGWYLHVNQEAGFALWLPATWVASNLEDATITQVSRRFNQLDPALGKYMAEALQVGVSNGMRLFAYYADPEAMVAGQLTSVNVLVIDLPRSIDVQVLGHMTETELKDLDHVSEVGLGFLTVGGVEAAQLTYRLETEGPQGKQTLRNQQVLIPIGKRVYVLTFSAPANRFWHYIPIFDQIRDSFRSLRAPEEATE